MRKRSLAERSKYIIYMVISIVFTIMLATVLLAPGTALAEESSSAKANTGVYLYSDEPIEPVDPTDPTDPVEPTEPTDRPTPDENGTVTGGNLFPETSDSTLPLCITAVFFLSFSILLPVGMKMKGGYDEKV